MSKPDEVYDAVLVVLDTNQRTAGEIARKVSRKLGREIHVASVLRCLRRAQRGGAAKNHNEGGKCGQWTEPDDEYSAGAA